MKIFLTGATGWIGSAVAQELINAGNSVTGLVRSVEKSSILSDAGITPVIGSLGDRKLLQECAKASDGIIHTAFGQDFSNYEALSKEDRAAIETFADAFAGSDRPIIVTSGLGSLAGTEPFTEESRPAVIAHYPRASEQTAFALAGHGVHASVVRPARSVHGLGERHGFIPMLAAIARHRGVSAYIGDGTNEWPAVHRNDAARVYRLALERGAAGEAYHAVAEGVPFRRVAEAIGRQVGVPTTSLTSGEAETHFGALAVWLSGSTSVATNATRATLGWSPREIDLISDIERPEYYG